MKKILLLSDTHGHYDSQIEKFIIEADEIWHAGDIGGVETADKYSAIKPFKAVYGNIDSAEVRKCFPLWNIFETEGVKIAITHIGGYPGRYPAAVKQKLRDVKPDLFICGHSHILKVMHDPDLNLLHMNPGACGIAGFHRMRTMLRFQIGNGKIEKLDVIELGPRSISSVT